MAQYLLGEIDRLCRVRTTLDDDAEEPFATTDDGFLVPPVELFDRPRPGAIVTPQVAAGSGSLVLLGEPGVGKTTAFRRLVMERESESRFHEVVWIEAVALVDATFDAMIGRHLSSSEPASLTVVIDQLDESQMLGRLAARLRTVGVSRRPVTFLVACRTAEFPRDLSTVLKDLSGSCVVADLAPLTKQQATDLVTGHAYSPAELIDAAIDSGAGALASVPLTLEVIGRVFESRGQLPRRAADLFALAVERLAEEPIGGLHATASQRVAIAGRAAARMLLSGRRTLWNGRALDAAPGDLNVSALEGGTENCLESVDVKSACRSWASGTLSSTRCRAARYAAIVE
jgi:hypothetical protein